MAAPAPSKKQEQALQSREKLIDAATALFAEHGYRDTSVQAIGEQAGVSRGSIFWHFGSKEGLLWAVVERAFTAWEAETLVPDIGDTTGMEAVRRALRSHRTFLTGDTAALKLFYTLMFEALGPRPELAGEFARLHRELRRMSVGWIAAGSAAGDLRSDLDPETVVTLMTAALGGIVYQYLLDDTLDLDALYGGLEQVLVRGLAP
jgi:AcrR family transcriptional regulator